MRILRRETFRSILPLMALFIMLPVSVSAQTEVAGRVSGEWTVENSPYVVVGTIRVPEDEELFVQPGVEIRFENDRRLDVYGTLRAIGSEEDSIRFLASEEDGTWQGINFHSSEAENRLSYSVMKDVQNALMYGTEIILNIDNCDIQGIYKVLYVIDYQEDRGSEITISTSNLSVNGEDGVVVMLFATRIIIDECNISNNFDFEDTQDQTLAIRIGDGGFCRVTNSIVTGSVSSLGWGTVSEFENCEFLPAGRNRIDLGDRGYIRNCVIIGNLFSDICFDFEITDLTIIGGASLNSFSGNISGLNVTAGSFRVRYSGIDYDNEIINSEFLGRTFIDLYDPRISLNISDCTFQDVLDFSGRREETPPVVLERSVLLQGIRSTADGLLLINNTFFRSDTTSSDGIPLKELHLVYNFTMLNNIVFITPGEGTRYLFYLQSIDPEEITIKYNCFYGYDELFYWDSLDLDESNLFVDPEFEANQPDRLNLRQTSPCIDAGDPENSLDPDGTRADMGAFYFHQNYVTDNMSDQALTGYKLFSAYPNPFNSHLNIQFNLSRPGWVNLRLIDLSGRELFREGILFNANGRQSFILDGSGFPSGSYLISVQTDRQVISKSVNLIR